LASWSLEAEALVKPVGVVGAEPPPKIAVRTVVDGLPYKLEPEPSSAVFSQDVDVAQGGDVHIGRKDLREPDLLLSVVEANDPSCVSNPLLNRLARASARPIGLIAQIIVDHGHIDPGAVIINLEAL